MKNFLILLILFSLIFSGCNSSEKNPANQTNQEIQQPRVCFESGKCISIELAKTESEKAKGLMYRDSLGENSGMLFVFEKENIPSFWMKNMKISLDIIWINADYEIADVSKNVQPCDKEPCDLYSPKIPAKYVLEVNSGFFEKNNLKIREKVELNNLTN